MTALASRADDTSAHPRVRLLRAGRLAALVAVIAVASAGCKYSVFAPSPQAAAPQAVAVAASSPEGIIRQVFGPLGVADQAVGVAACESGLNPGADSGTYKGLFQLGPHLAGSVDAYGGDWFDPMTNTLVARDLYVSHGGWSSWGACRR